MSPDSSTPQDAIPSRRLTNIALVGAAALAVVGGVAFYLASTAVHDRPQAESTTTTVTVTATACEPDVLTVPAGTARFAIVNASSRVLEWEILDGVMVVAERENIAPGMTATMSPRLAPGSYAITCGLLSNPRGALTVTPNGEAGAPVLNLTAFIRPLAEQKFALTTQGKTFTESLDALTAAIRSGDLAAARAAYPAASAAYRPLAALARRFSDLDEAIDGSATYYTLKEADPAFTGLHRIEYGLFGRQSLDGLAPTADKLDADAATLLSRLGALKPDPDNLGPSTSSYMSSLAETAIPAGAELYAGTDLLDLSSALDAADRTIALLRPLGARTAEAQLRRIDGDLAKARAAIDALRAQPGMSSYTEVSADARQALAADFAALASSLDALNARLVLSPASS